MNTLQSLTVVIATIFALSVIVQATQEFIKDFLQTKPRAMMQALSEFMGDMLNAADVKQALSVRGLDVTALESFSPSDFRDLLDAIPFNQQQLQTVQRLVHGDQVSLDKIKDNIAGAYQGALARFQKIYQSKNKRIAALLSLILVLLLNANVIFLYESISADPATQQAIMSKVQTIVLADTKANASSVEAEAQTRALKESYQATRDQIAAVLNTDAMLVRTKLYPDDFSGHWLKTIFGLSLMGALVSLGAPFWNDILKGATGINSAFNGNGKKS